MSLSFEFCWLSHLGVKAYFEALNQTAVKILLCFYNFTWAYALKMKKKTLNLNYSQWAAKD